MEPSPSDLRLVGRLMGEYILRWAEIAGPHFGGDLTMAMIYTAVVQANVRDVLNDPDLDRQYAATPPPDSIRRPATMTSIAASLGLPRETVRRHIHRMIETGAVIKKDGGVVVAQATLESPAGLESALLQYAAARRFVLALRKAGVSFAQNEAD